MSSNEKSLSIKAYVDGKETAVEIPYESLFEFFEFREQYEEYKKDIAHKTGEKSENIVRESAKLFMKYGVCSTGILQRKFHIGYGRAASIIEELEELGVITPPIDNKRFIKVKTAKELDEILNNH